MSDEDKKTQDESTEELKNEETKEQAEKTEEVSPKEEKQSSEETKTEEPKNEETKEQVEEPKADEKGDEGSEGTESVEGAKNTEETTPETSETPPEPPSAIAPEMQDTTGHKGKVMGAEDIQAGMTIRVHERIVDITPKGDKRERTQIFEGIILGISGGGNKKTMTVRKISKGGFAVEKIFPLASPNVQKIEVVKIARARRAKLTYLRNLKRRFKKKLKETWVK
jgi:large subunit ribosomal protein L19